jgi:zinc D-Ala-D-Ala carboxypeptidase
MAIYFTNEEMIQSATARIYGVENRPESTEITENLKKTMYILDIIRTFAGVPIVINSGYRCKKLNELVGGTSNSYHLKGLAADFRTYNRKNMTRIFDFLTKNKEKFHIKELINYGGFIHIAISESLTI